MFGYIKPEKPELKIKDYDLFRAYYCGVCKSIGRTVGQLPRLTLSYDATFLALILSSVLKSESIRKFDRCILHPLKKRSVICNDVAVDYAAHINILLFYHSLVDKWKDEKSLLSIPGMVVLKFKYNKLKNIYKNECDIIESSLKNLSRLETEKCPSVDEAAEPFATLMAEILGGNRIVKDEKIEKILRWLGYNLGKWIYIIDAFEDIEQDICNKSYNPLIYQYKYEDEQVQTFKERIRKNVEFILTYSLNEISKSFELLEVKRNRELVENIIYMGMLRQTEIILYDKKCPNSSVA